MQESLGPYRIAERLGAGGMGEVWRAHDPRLDREVALKLLPAELADEPDRLARFRREAKLLAALNHPCIAAIHGIEEDQGRLFLVMELAEGEDLSRRLERGPVPVDEAVRIALRLAEGLEEAHAKGIVHRDLKPANVVVSPEGSVKILDFGLARAYQGDEVEESDPAHSPTLTAAMTAQGMILGTAAYMSPEQARGRSVDRRADIWAFGVILYEMLTGRRLFAGETVSDTLAAVLRGEPDWSALPASTPAWLGHLLRRCLQRDRRLRLQDIGEARIALAGEGESLAAAPAKAVVTRDRHLEGILLGAVVLLLLTVVGLGWRVFSAPSAPTPLLQASLLPPEGTDLYLQGRQPGSPALSPDGSRLAFVAREKSGRIGIWLRDLDQSRAVALPETDGASYPFWSPDGRKLGFFADGKLKRMDLESGATLVLADAPFGKGGSWSREETILFAPTYNSGIVSVPATGGKAVDRTRLDRARGENSHRHPVFLPDGRHFLYFVRGASVGGEDEGSAVWFGSLDGGQPRRIVASPSHALFADGRLLFVQDAALMAQPFDPVTGELGGAPRPVLPEVETLGSAARTLCTVSADGKMVYQAVQAKWMRQLVWYDREGRQKGTLGDPATYYNPTLSPDREHVALEVDPGSGNGDIWIYDVQRGVRSRFTFDSGYESSPVWSPDGGSLAYGSNQEGVYRIYRRPVSGDGEATVLLESEVEVQPSSWSPDGKWLLYTREGQDILALPLDGGEALPVRVGGFNEWAGAFSPDGKWVAYHSNETGDFEIYLMDFPEGRRKYQISAGGGIYPRWSGADEIVYITLENDVTAVRLDLGRPMVEISAPRTLFTIPTATDSEFLVDGDRLLVYTLYGEIPPLSFSLVSDWHRLLGS